MDEQLAKQTRFVVSHLYGVQSVVLWTHWPSPLQIVFTKLVGPEQLDAPQVAPAG